MNLFQLFRTFIGRHLLKNPLRSGLTVAGIALGVAILLAIHLANASVLRNFKSSIDTVSGKTNLVIVSTAEPVFSDDILSSLRWVWLTGGVYTPVLEAQAAIPASGGSGKAADVVQVLGVNMLGDPAFRSYDWSFRGAPKEPFQIFRASSAFVGHRLLGQEQLPRLDLLVNDKRVTLDVAGVMTDEGLGGAFSGNLVLMDLSGAQALYGQNGRISRVDLIIPPENLAAVTEKLRRDLPPTLAVQSPSQRGEQVEKMIRSFQYNLTALSFISLLVGMFLIYNTMSIAVLRRRPEIGTLRALGASRRDVLALFGLESLTLGVVGTVLGLLGGIAFARMALSSVSRTVETLYVTQAGTQLEVTPGPLLWASLIGIGLTLVASLPPMLESTTVPPAEATRRRSDEVKVGRLFGKLAGGGLALWGLAVLAAFQPPVGSLPLFGYVSALFAVLGGALLMPFLLSRMLPALGGVLKKAFGMEGHLSRLSLQGSLGRTSVAVASLMVGIAMMISLAVMIGSFRQTVITWVDQTFKADLLVKPAAKVTGKVSVLLDPRIEEVVRQTPGVKAVDAFYEYPITYRGNPTNLGVGDLPVLFREGTLMFLDRESPDQVLTRMREHPSVIVTESFSLKNHLGKGDVMTLSTPKGPLKVVIEGVYYDYSSEQGYVILPRFWFSRYFQGSPVSDLAVYLTPDASPEAVRAEIIRRAGSEAQLIVSTQREIKQEVLLIFDNTFSITYALHLIAITVAILGVMNTLLALVLESRRDFGILRYLGASGRQIRKIVLVQAGLLGFLGNLTGLGMGLVLSLLLIHVINKQSFGWSIRFSLEPAFLIQSFLLVMASALLSGLIPAGMAARLPAPEVVREE